MRHVLPTFPTPFIGRADEIAELSQLLDNPDCRLLTLVGPGGIGKTRLAVEVARYKLNDFPDGVYFVSLQPLQASDQVLSAVIDTLSLQVSDDPRQQLLDYLHEKRLLLVLDNVEHVLESAALVSDILAAAPQVCVLATTREVLNLQSEWVRHVDGLHYPGNDDLGDKSDDGATQLFADRAQRLNSDFSLADEHDHVVRICQLVEGMPLALELAAGWLRVMPCAAIVEQIQRNLDILTTNQRDRVQRHQSIRAVFDQSWYGLSVDEQAIFRRLAVFRGSFGLEAAEQVAGATLGMLASFVDKSLVRVDEAGRYSLHELVRQFAAERMVVAGESEAVDKAHCDYYADFLQSREPGIKGGRQFETFAEIAAEFENIRAAWHWAVDHREYDAIDRSIECLYRYVHNQHISILDDEFFLQVAHRLRHAEETPSPSWGRVIVRSCFRFPREKMVPDVELALRMAQQRGDVAEIGHSLHMLGTIAIENNRYTDALAWHEQSLETYRHLDDRFYIADALIHIAFCYREMGEFNEMQVYTDQSLTLRRAIDDCIGVVWCLLGQAGRRLWQGDYDLSKPLLLEALDLIRSEYSDRGIAMARVKAILYHALCTCLGFIALLQGDHNDARKYRQAVDPGEANLSDLINRYNSIALTGIDTVLEGDNETGEKLLSWIHAGFVDMFWLDSPIARWGLSIVYVVRGDSVQAHNHIMSLLHEGLTQNRPILVTLALPVAALILAHNGDHKRAAQLLGLAFTHPKSATGWMEQWPRLTHLRADLEAELCTEAYEAAWAHGATLDLETTAADLLRHFDGDHRTQQQEANATLEEPLTARELEVLGLLAQGHSNRQIAEPLVIEIGTVKRYVYDICQKLDADNRTHAVVRARELGLL